LKKLLEKEHKINKKIKLFYKLKLGHTQIGL